MRNGRREQPVLPPPVSLLDITFPSVLLPFLGSWPGVLDILDNPGILQKDEKRWLFPVSLIPDYSLFYRVFGNIIDGFLHIPGLHLLDSFSQTRL